MHDFIEQEKFELEVMRSGHSSLNLTSLIEWEDFPELAAKLAQDLEATIEKKMDSFDIRVWELSISGVTLRLVFDDFPVMVSLESTSDAGDEMLAELHAKIRTEC